MNTNNLKMCLIRFSKICTSKNIRIYMPKKSKICAEICKSICL